MDQFNSLPKVTFSKDVQRKHYKVDSRSFESNLFERTNVCFSSINWVSGMVFREGDHLKI